MASAQRRSRLQLLAVRRHALYPDEKPIGFDHNSCLHCEMSFSIWIAHSVAYAGCRAIDLSSDRNIDIPAAVSRRIPM